MKKLFMLSATLLGLLALQACDKKEKKVEKTEKVKVEKPEEGAATLGFFTPFENLAKGATNSIVPDFIQDFSKKNPNFIHDFNKKH